MYVYDINTGQQLNHTLIPDVQYHNGLEFSPNARFLYFTYQDVFNNGTVGYLDLNNSSPSPVNFPNGNAFGLSGLEIGPDERIYAGNQNNIARITNPDAPTPASFQPAYFSLTGYNVTANSSIIFPNKVDGEALGSLTENCCVSPQGEDFHWEDRKATDFSQSTFINKTITIEGTFTVDKNMGFLRCNIYMRPGAKIVIKKGNHLIVRMTDIEACRDMWDGIYIEDQSAKLTVWNNPGGPFSQKYIRHAINGIVSQNGGEYDFRNANLEDNYYHLQVHPFQGTHQSTITNTNFTCNPAGIGRFPHVNDITYHAIHVIDVSNIEIGRSQFTPDVLKNQVDFAFTGIYTENSGILINNNLITHVEDVGIHAIANDPGATPQIITNYRNRIEFSNNYGILVQGFKSGYDADLKNLEVKATSNTGIKVQFCENSNVIRISNNILRDNWQGNIWALNNQTALVNIEDNDIQNNTSISWTAPGIIVTEAISPSKGGHSPLVHVLDNNITNVWGGVYMANLLNPLAEDNTVSLSSYINPTGVRAGGIYGEETPDATIRNNTVTMLTPSGYNEMIGVGVDNSKNCIIRENYVEGVESGIWIGGTSFGTQYGCNQLVNNNVGLKYNFAFVGQQGDPSNPADNLWQYSGGFMPFADTYMFSSDGEQAEFWVRDTPTGYEPLINKAAGFFPPIVAITPKIVSNPPSLGCFFNSSPSSNAVAGVVSGQAAFGNPWAGTRRWTAGQQIFRMMKEDSILITISQVYQDFHDSLAIMPVGSLTIAEICLANQDTAGAWAALTGLTCSDTVEQNLHTAEWIYLQTFARGIYSFDSTQTQVLQAVASQKLAQGGKGTLMARMMLNAASATPNYFWIEAEDSIVWGGNPSRQMQETEEAVGAEISMYPNPAADLLYLELPEGESAILKIYTLTGTLVLEEVWEGISGVRQISLSRVPQGIYLCEITAGGTVIREKLVITR